MGVWALCAYIAVILLWNGVLRRSIAEAMLLGFLAVVLFGGRSAPELAWHGIRAAATTEVMFAALAFVFMAFVLTRTGLVDDLVAMLNSLLGRRRGGVGYVATVASGLFGALSGSGSGNAAAVGAVAIPWMMRSNFSPELSATIVAGNAGLGIAIPPSSSLFILLASATVASLVKPDELFLALYAGGAWTLVYRLLVIRYFVWRHGIGPVHAEALQPLRTTLARGWPSLLVFIGIAIPVLLTVGPTGAMLAGRVGDDAAAEVSIVTWIPVLVTSAAVIVGRRMLPRTWRAWWALAGDVGPKYAVVGATLFFAFAAADTLTRLDLANELGMLLARVRAPAPVVALLVGVLIVGVAAPLTATATIVAVGPVAFTSLVAAGVAPLPAAVAILIFASTEGASPPGAAPIYIASGLAGVDPGRTFVPLLVWYVAPILLIGALIAVGLLPV